MKYDILAGFIPQLLEVRSCRIYPAEVNKTQRLFEENNTWVK